MKDLIHVLMHSPCGPTLVLAQCSDTCTFSVWSEPFSDACSMRSDPDAWFWVGEVIVIIYTNNYLAYASCIINSCIIKKEILIT